jgi:hypothetical protein
MDRSYFQSDDLDALLGTGSGGRDPASAAWWDRFLAADPRAARAARGLVARLRRTRPSQEHLDRRALLQIQRLLQGIYAYVQRTGDLLPAAPSPGRRASPTVH